MYAEKNKDQKLSVCRKRRTFRLAGCLLAGAILTGAACFGGWNASAGAAVTQPVFTQPPADTAPPVIRGNTGLTVYAGDQVLYRDGITVTDDLDPSPVLEVDASQVDLTRPGTYFVTYRATDAAGNESCLAATVTVLPEPEAQLRQIQEATDAVLVSIIKPGMNHREKAEAVYSWIRENLTYQGTSARNDWLQAGFSALSSRSGDCYGFFSAAKLLLERLEIPNIDVAKLPADENDSEHYWSLVSTDGGETYYHFDCTPRVGQAESFCLITDAALDAYSQAHGDSHRRDTSLYPATPED